jgi:hypothetical protein
MTKALSVFSGGAKNKTPALPVFLDSSQKKTPARTEKRPERDSNPSFLVVRELKWLLGNRPIMYVSRKLDYLVMELTRGCKGGVSHPISGIYFSENTCCTAAAIRNPRLRSACLLCMRPRTML